ARPQAASRHSRVHARGQPRSARYPCAPAICVRYSRRSRRAVRNRSYAASFVRRQSLEQLSALGHLIDGGQSDHVITGIYVMDLASHGAAQIRKQIEPRIADLFDRHVAAQWCVELVPLQNETEIPDAGSGQGLDRSGRNGIDANALLAEVL